MTDFTRTKSRFAIPDGLIYLDGNSLGPLPVAAADRVGRMISEEWGKHLIKGWNVAGWMTQPRRVGDRIARLIGAADGTVVVGDTLSIKVYQALASALELNPSRRVILSDTGNFPSDLYIASGLLGSLDRGYALKVVAPEDVEAAIDETIAVLMLTEVDYRTGRLHDMTRADTQGACCRRVDGLGSGAFRRRDPGRPVRRRSRFRRRLHLQISQCRSWRAGFHLCRA